MSEKKDASEINFDDSFLEIDFGEKPVNDATENAENISLDLELDNAIDLTTSNATSDISSNDNPTQQTAPQTEAISDDDFFHQLDDLNQADELTPNSDGVSEEVLMAGVAGIGAAAATDTKLTPKKKKSLNKLFDKKEKISKTVTSKPHSKADITGVLSDPRKLNKLILGGIIALALIGIALYMAMSGNDSQPTLPPQNNAPVPAQQEPTPPTTQEIAPKSDLDSADTATQNNNDILPDIKPLVNPDEILNAGIPDDPALIKEEIDRLTDTNNQITEQEKLVQEQLAMMAELTAAKEEAIALLEAQIAQELEKQQKSEPSN